MHGNLKSRFKNLKSKLLVAKLYFGGSFQPQMKWIDPFHLRHVVMETIMERKMGIPKHRLIAWSLWANKIAYLPVRADFAIYPALHIDNMFTFLSGIGSFLQYVNFAGNRFLFWKYLHFTFWKSVAYWSPPSGFTFLWYFQLSFWILVPFWWTFTSLTLNGLLYIVFWWKFTFLTRNGLLYIGVLLFGENSLKMGCFILVCKQSDKAEP